MKFRKLSFQKKIYLSCITINLIFLSVCSALFYHYTTKTLKQNMHDTVSSSTSTLSKNFDALLSNADNVLKELQTTPSLLSESKRITQSPSNYFPAHVPASTVFQNAFRNVLLSQDFNGSLIYVSNYYDNVGVSSTKTGVHNYVQKEKLKEQKVLSQLLEDIKYIEYILPHRDFWGQNETVVSVVRAMRDTYQHYGILELDLNISMLTDLLNDYENPESYSITLLDEDKKLVYTNALNMDKAAFYAAFQTATDKNTEIFSPDDLQLSCYVESPLTGWTFILSTSAAGYLQSINRLLLMTMAIFLALFAVISIFLYLVTKQLTKPLKQLTTQLNHLKPGRNIKISEISSDNEITMLTNAVQAFLAEIYDQNQRLTEERKRTLEAHYDALESQLNPHFLYNTLSVIGMTGLSDGNTTVSTMCSELASLLRYSLSHTGQSVLLEQEIAKASSYLYIMKMRYEEDLTYEWDLDSSLNSIPVPKLILQPLLENCFQHGFQQTEQEILPPWIIKIRSSHDEDYWYLSVSNNGADFKEEKLHLLYQRIRQFNLPDYNANNSSDLILRQGYGLENTILRLNIYYHGKEFFQVSKPDSGWTAITIGGPLKPMELFTRNYI
ncbi:histidine kinase [Blautia schinkii]|nr:histidine kinase [Blautia schinkii]